MPYDPAVQDPSVPPPWSCGECGMADDYEYPLAAALGFRCPNCHAELREVEA